MNGSTPIANMVAAMLAKGVPADVIVLAVQGAEEAARGAVSGGNPVDEAAEKRRAWDREYRANKRKSGGQSGGSRVDTNHTSTLKTESEIQDEGRAEAPTAPASGGQSKSKRGTRLPDDWAPSSADVASARLHGLNDETIRREATKFRNYWTSKTGASATKLDWSRTWENWILNTRGGGPVGGGVSGGPPRGGNGGMAAVLAKLQEDERNEPTFDNFDGPTIDVVPDRGEPSDGGPGGFAPGRTRD